jgi:hypothetical protein
MPVHSVENPNESLAFLMWNEKPNHPSLDDPSYYPRGFKHSLRVGVTPSRTGKIFVHYPGHNENIDGPNRRYARLVRQVHQLGVASTVRSANKPPYGFLSSTHLNKIIEHCLENSEKICGTKDPEINLMGFSSGGSAVASLASRYKEISKILLMAPSADMPKMMVAESLGSYKGEVSIIIGQDDEVVDKFMGYLYYDLALAALKKSLYILEQCDHGFSSRVNEMIYLNAPILAFANK